MLKQLSSFDVKLIDRNQYSTTLSVKQAMSRDGRTGLCILV